MFDFFFRDLFMFVFVYSVLVLVFPFLNHFCDSCVAFVVNGKCEDEMILNNMTIYYL